MRRADRDYLPTHGSTPPPPPPPPPPRGTASARHPAPRVTPAALLEAITLEEFAPDGNAMLNALFPPKHERDRRTNPSIVDVYWDHLCLGLSKSSNTVHGYCMRVLGELAHYFPTEVAVEHQYEKGLLYDRCINTFLKADGSKPPTAWMLSGALAGLDGLLKVVEPTQEKLEQVWDQAVKCLSMTEELSDGTLKELKRFTVPRAALSLLGRNMGLFACDDEGDGRFGDAATRLGASLLLARVEVLMPLLLQLGDNKNRDIRNAAVDVTREVLKRVARLLCQGAAEPAHQERARAVYAYLSQHVPRMVAKVAELPRDGDGSAVGYLVRWVGALAGPMRVFNDEALLQQQLHDLCARADDFFQASAARHVEQVRRRAEERTQQLPAFLEAFAQVLDELPAVDAYTMKTLHELLQLLLRQFGALQQFGGAIQRRRNADALQLLLLALLDKGGALEQLLRPFVYSGLLVTILSASAFARREYVAQLWQPLLDPAPPPPQQWTSFRWTRRSGGGRDGGALAGGGAADEDPRRFAVCDRVFGHLMASLVQMLHKFDLGALSEANDEPPADDGAAGAAPEASEAPLSEGVAAEPGEAAEAPVVVVSGRTVVKNVGDLALFLALIEVCEALLPKADPRMLLSHAHVLSLELVDKATAYPHVSGFYKLMRLLVLACEEHGYFDAPPPPPPPPPAAAAAGEPTGNAAAGSDVDMEVDDGGGGVAAMEVDGGPAVAVAARPDPNAERCYTMLGGFLAALLQRSKRFHDELQAAAMALLLAAPRRFVAQQTDGMAEVLTLALGMGHAYKPLALDALDALEAWLRSRELRPLLRPLLPRVLPCLQAGCQ